MGVASDWAASWGNIVDFWGIVVEILHLFGRVSFSFVGNGKRYVSCSFYLWRDTLNSVLVKECTFGELISEFAVNILGWFESISEDNDLSASLGWTFSRIDIKDSGRSEIEVRHVIISVLLVVQGDFDVGLIEHEVRGCLAIELCGTENVGLGFTNTFEFTEGVVGVVNALINEWHEICSPNDNLVASSVRTVVWNKLHNLWPIVVVEFNIILRVLLFVKGNGERLWLADYI